MLRGADNGLAVTGQAASQAAQAAIKRVEREVGLAPAAVNVLSNLGMVVVDADERFVRKLLEQPEFDSAVPNARDVAKAATSRAASAPDGRSSKRGRSRKSNS